MVYPFVFDTLLIVRVCVRVHVSVCMCLCVSVLMCTCMHALFIGGVCF